MLIVVESPLPMSSRLPSCKVRASARTREAPAMRDGRCQSIVRALRLPPRRRAPARRVEATKGHREASSSRLGETRMFASVLRGATGGADFRSTSNQGGDIRPHDARSAARPSLKRDAAIENEIPSLTSAAFTSASSSLAQIEHSSRHYDCPPVALAAHESPCADQNALNVEPHEDEDRFRLIIERASCAPHLADGVDRARKAERAFSTCVIEGAPDAVSSVRRVFDWRRLWQVLPFRARRTGCAKSARTASPPSAKVIDSFDIGYSL